jgi:hypothetical protein
MLLRLGWIIAVFEAWLLLPSWREFSEAWDAMPRKR